MELIDKRDFSLSVRVLLTNDPVHVITTFLLNDTMDLSTFRPTVLSNSVCPWNNVFFLLDIFWRLRKESHTEFNKTVGRNFARSIGLLRKNVVMTRTGFYIFFIRWPWNNSALSIRSKFAKREWIRLPIWLLQIDLVLLSSANKFILEPFKYWWNLTETSGN